LRTVAQLSLCTFLAACLTATAEDGGAECKNKADGTDCSSGLCCNQVCSTFLTDPLNCGTCGLACPDNENCANGICIGCAQLPQGTSCNAGAYTGLCCNGNCANILSDHNNCGGCGDDGDAGPPYVCTIGQNCIDAGCIGQCVGATDNSICSIMTTDDGNCCNQVCTNPDNDSQNCYLCGNVCPTGVCEDSLCTCTGNSDCKLPSTCGNGICQ
jgi:hypothetical protein